MAASSLGPVTVDELIAKLQQLAAEGHGDREVFLVQGDRVIVTIEPEEPLTYPNPGLKHRGTRLKPDLGPT